MENNLKTKEQLIQEGYNFTELENGRVLLFDSNDNVSNLLDNPEACEFAGYSVNGNGECSWKGKILVDPNTGNIIVNTSNLKLVDVTSRNVSDVGNGTEIIGNIGELSIIDNNDTNTSGTRLTFTEIRSRCVEPRISERPEKEFTLQGFASQNNKYCCELLPPFNLKNGEFNTTSSKSVLGVNYIFRGQDGFDSSEPTYQTFWVENGDSDKKGHFYCAVLGSQAPKVENNCFFDFVTLPTTEVGKDLVEFDKTLVDKECCKTKSKIGFKSNGHILTEGDLGYDESEKYTVFTQESYVEIDGINRPNSEVECFAINNKIFNQPVIEIPKPVVITTGATGTTTTGTTEPIKIPETPDVLPIEVPLPTEETPTDPVVISEPEKPKPKQCLFEPYKVIVNTDKGGGSLFMVEANEKCDLDIKFDYLLDFNASELKRVIEDKSLLGEAIIESNINEGLTSLLEKNVEIKNLENRIKTKENTPYVLEYNELNFELRELGLVEWAKIIPNTYSEWLASNGSELTTYNSKDVEALLNKTNDVSFLYETTFNTNDKDISQKEIIAETILLNKAKAELNILTNKYKLSSETINKEYSRIFEILNIRVNLETKDPETKELTMVYTEKLFNLTSGLLSNITNNDVSGIKITNDDALAYSNSLRILNGELSNKYLETTGLLITEEIENKLLNWHKSCWLEKTIKINEQTIIDKLKGKEVIISFSVLNSVSDFGLLLDRLRLDKKCEKITNVETYISEPPKFEISKVIDNQKSWYSKFEDHERKSLLKNRVTEYKAKNPRLVINTKEMDLNLSPARALEFDSWTYINDNQEILGKCDDSEKLEFVCPAGYTLSKDGDSCYKKLNVPVSTNAPTLTIGDVYNLNTIRYSNIAGAIFIDDSMKGLSFPIKWDRTPLNTWIGEYYNSFYLSDKNGKLVKSSGFGELKNYDKIIYSSPEAFCGYRSKFGESDELISLGEVNPNILWGGTDGFINQVTAGRLINAGVWIKNEGSGGVFNTNKWVGISKTIEIDENKTYMFAFSATGGFKLKVNNENIYNTENNSIKKNNNGGFKNTPDLTRESQALIVVPIDLISGSNVIEIEAKSSKDFEGAGFVLEIYDADVNTLKTIRDESTLEMVTIFSTKTLKNTNFDYNGNSDSSCPSGYHINNSNGTSQCVKIERIFKDTSGDDCCCPGVNLKIKDFDNVTRSLPNTNGDNLTFNISKLSSDFNTYGIDIIKTNCSEIYKIGETTTTNDDSYLITRENDGSLGVYKRNWTNGNATSFNKLTSQLTSSDASTIKMLFETYETNRQGENLLPDFIWDEMDNLMRVVISDDKGCININEMLTTDITTFDSVEEYARTLFTELIDVKNRKSSTAYPTLKMLYNRYKFDSLRLSNNESSEFDYYKLDEFGRTIGDYWVDLIEQVIPSTTIWNSTYQYRNSIFDQQKFNYKRNSLFTISESTKFDNSTDVVSTHVENLTNGDKYKYNGKVGSNHVTSDTIFIGRVTNSLDVVNKSGNINEK